MSNRCADLAACDSPLDGLTEREAAARVAADALGRELEAALNQVQQLRSTQHGADGRLERLRRERDQARSELMSLEALQKAALREKNPRAGAWLAGVFAGASRAHVWPSPGGQGGWERAVETVLGDYLEAVGVEALEKLEPTLAGLDAGSLTFFEQTLERRAPVPAGTLAEQVRRSGRSDGDSGAGAHGAIAGAALPAPSQLPAGESLITAGGEWLGRDWLRVNRGGDVHAGCAGARTPVEGVDANPVRSGGPSACASWIRRLRRCARRSSAAEQRARCGAGEHSGRTSRSRGAARLTRGSEGSVGTEQQSASLPASRPNRRGPTGHHSARRKVCARARAAHEGAVEALARLDAQRPSWREERELFASSLTSARAARRRHRLELHESPHSRWKAVARPRVSMASSLERMLEQRTGSAQRGTLQRTLADGDAPIEQLQTAAAGSSGAAGGSRERAGHCAARNGGW